MPRQVSKQTLKPLLKMKRKEWPRWCLIHNKLLVLPLHSSDQDCWFNMMPESKNYWYCCLKWYTYKLNLFFYAVDIQAWQWWNPWGSYFWTTCRRSHTWSIQCHSLGHTFTGIGFAQSTVVYYVKRQIVAWKQDNFLHDV